MSFANTIGQTFTGVVGHRGRMHLPGRRAAAPAAASERVSSSDAEPRRGHAVGPVDVSSADQRRELEQWSAALIVAVGLNR